jgi:hypothetical protein
MDAPAVARLPVPRIEDFGPRGVSEVGIVSDGHEQPLE